jgi:hypothetical protein
MGRLQNQAFQFVMSRQCTKPDGSSEPAPDWCDINGDEDWQSPPVLAGLQFLSKALKQEYGADKQDDEWSRLESYFELKQSSSSFESCVSIKKCHSTIVLNFRL